LGPLLVLVQAEGLVREVQVEVAVPEVCEPRAIGGRRRVAIEDVCDLCEVYASHAVGADEQLRYSSTLPAYVGSRG